MNSDEGEAWWRPQLGALLAWQRLFDADSEWTNESFGQPGQTARHIPSSIRMKSTTAKRKLFKRKRNKHGRNTLSLKPCSVYLRDAW